MHEVSQKELADMLNVTTRQVRNWERDGIPHRAEKNRKYYDRHSILWWHEREVARRIDDAEVSAVQKVRARKLEAETGTKELELARLRSEVVPVEYMRKEFEKAARLVRAEIDNIPPRHGADVRPEDPGAGELVLEEVMQELLGSMLVAFGVVPEDLEDGDDRNVA